MGKVRMLDPSSGRDNFDVVSNETIAANTSASHISPTTNQDPKKIEEKTQDAIKTALASQSQQSSKESKSNQ